MAFMVVSASSAMTTSNAGSAAWKSISCLRVIGNMGNRTSKYRIGSSASVREPISVLVGHQDARAGATQSVVTGRFCDNPELIFVDQIRRKNPAPVFQGSIVRRAVMFVHITPIATNMAVQKRGRLHAMLFQKGQCGRSGHNLAELKQRRSGSFEGLNVPWRRGNVVGVHG